MVTETKFDRRDFLKLGIAATGGVAFGGGIAGAAVANARPAALSELGYSQVDLAPGAPALQVSQNRATLLNLDEDSLLRPFRVRAGMAAPGVELGGWYGTYAFAPGATFGQWLAALSRYYSIAPDDDVRGKVARLVRGYAATIDGNGAFYTNNRFPAYIYDKLVLGLIDAKRYVDDPIAMKTLERTTTAAYSHLPPRAMPRDEHSHPPQDFTEHAWDESYTLAENQFFAAQLTGRRVHRELARRFLYNDFFFALANDENVLPGKHAYSHVNGLSSAAQAYLALGDARYLAAIRNGFRMIDEQSFATGGWGPDEHFVVPGSGKLGDSLTGEHKSFETPCGAYAHFKLTRYLLRITRDSRYGDSMERVFYNTVLGAKPIQPDGRAFYYSDYTSATTKGFHPDPWPCCSGSLPLIAADYRISAYFSDADGIFVNLYTPSSVRWRQRDAACRLDVVTDYPYSSHIGMIVRAADAKRFTISLRIPAWANGASIDVNGKSQVNAATPGTFAAITREWRAGDRIDLNLPLTMSLNAVDAEHPDTVALMCGPLVLMRLDDATPTTRAALLSARQKSAGARDWSIDRDPNPIAFRAFPEITTEKYTTYQSVAASKS